MTDAEKPYWEMTDAELRVALDDWGARVDGASGFPSAYFAAKQCEAVTVEAARRGLIFDNRWPIKKG